MKWKIGQEVCFGEKSRYGCIIDVSGFPISIQANDAKLIIFPIDSPRVHCSHSCIERDDYLNPCSMAGCKLNGQYTYHLGCGSQYKERCEDCGVLLYDSAQEEIDSAEWEDREYRCNACQEEIQPGHFACGETFSVSV